MATHGGAGEPGSAAQVMTSSTPPAVVSDEVIARKSAVIGGCGKVVTSILSVRTYGHALLTEYAGPLSTAAPAPGLIGTVTLRVAVVTLPDESVTLSVTV